jgi:hypothetical protein
MEFRGKISTIKFNGRIQTEGEYFKRVAPREAAKNLKRL